MPINKQGKDELQRGYPNHFSLFAVVSSVSLMQPKRLKLQDLQSHNFTSTDGQYPWSI